MLAQLLRRIPALMNFAEVPSLAVLAGSFFLFAASTAISLELVREFPRGAQLWLGPGLLAGTLLRQSRRFWPYFLAAYVAAALSAYVPFGYLSWSAIRRSSISIGEALFIAHFLKDDSDWLLGRSDRLAAWGRFAAFGVLSGPALGAIPGALILVYERGADFATAFRSWFTAHALAFGIVVPAMLRLRQAQFQDLRQSGRLWELVVWLIAFGSVAVGVYSYGVALPLFVLPPFLVVILFRFGFTGLIAGMGILTILTIAVNFTRTGPFFLMAGAEGWWGADSLAQVFLLLLFGTLTLIAALLDESRMLHRIVDLNDDIYRLIAQQSGEIIFVADPEGRNLYVSPVTEEICGVPASELLGLGWQRYVHSEDVKGLTAAFSASMPWRPPMQLVYRLLCHGTEYRWFELRCRAARREPSRQHQIIAITRDVTDRKRREQDLEALNAALESAAATDPLTGLANRRRFHEVKRIVWQESIGRQSPLSLLVIDIDRFKLYNDSYGHSAGDTCLIAVAKGISNAMPAPAVCSRFGGEEFVVILPEHDAEAAAAAAKRVRAAVHGLQLPHSGTEGGWVTVSIGIATVYPVAPEDDGLLFEAADSALFRAKQSGRDRAESAQMGTVRFQPAGVPPSTAESLNIPISPHKEPNKPT